MNYDLNCDVGEGEPLDRTLGLLRVCTSASICCGRHAGNLELTAQVARMAQAERVRIGAHPGLMGGFGRIDRDVTPEELEQLLSEQVGDFARILERIKGSLHHLKLHGSLYHMMESNPVLRDCYLTFAAKHFPGAKIFAVANGQVVREGRERGLEVWEEAFLDRHYMPDGRLVARTKPEAILPSVSALNTRVLEFRDRKIFRAFNGQEIKFAPRTLSVHADTPFAVDFAEQAARILAIKKPAAPTDRAPSA